jgi:pyruvate,orthophosphate dikinase
MAHSTYFFGDGRSDGHAGMESLLGVRGAHVCEMANLGLPVSPGFCITSKFLNQDKEGSLPLFEDAHLAIKQAVGRLEEMVDRRFSHTANPLLLSVQGESLGAIPGFQGAVANIGMNDKLVEVWTARESPHFVWDSYRRLISTFSRAVRRLDMAPFEAELREVKTRLNAQCQLGREHGDCHIPTNELRNLVDRYKELFEEQTGEPFPQEPEKQLLEAVRAAASTWDEGQSKVGAVMVQSTIFGNYNFRSAVGVTYSASEGDSSMHESDDGFVDDAFAPSISGQWLTKAQNEDLLGDRIPLQLTEDASRQWAAEHGMGETEREQEYLSLEEDMPSIFAQLLHCQDVVETHIADAKGLEFAVWQGKLYLLQTYSPKQQMVPLSDLTLRVATEIALAPPEVSDAETEEQLDTSVRTCGRDIEWPWHVTDVHSNHLLQDLTMLPVEHLEAQSKTSKSKRHLWRFPEIVMQWLSV